MTATHPEVGVTPQTLVDRAIALRPKLIEEQAATEERTYYSQEMHEEFQRAGFYRLYIPRRYGGYEFDVPAMMRLMLETARGCPSTAWCMGLASGHALQLGSWWPEQAQTEIFGDGDFRAASVAAPIGFAERTADGWSLTGRVSYCSGIPYSTHYMGQALTPGRAAGRAARAAAALLRAGGVWEMHDDWGHPIGLKGSGSHSITLRRRDDPGALGDRGRVHGRHGESTTAPRATGCTATRCTSGGRSAVHDVARRGDHAGPASTRSTSSRTSCARSRRRCRPSCRASTTPTSSATSAPRRRSCRWPQAAMYRAADMHMELCERAADKGIPFSYADDHLVGAIAREAYIFAWEAMEQNIWRTAGSSSTRDGERMQRMFRDMAMIAGHRNTQLRDFAYRELAAETFGIPRDPATGNRQQVLRGN